MIASPHIVVGSAMGLWSFNLFRGKNISIIVAFTVGIASHFVLDQIPHEEYVRGTLVLVCLMDVIIAITLSLRFGWTKLPAYSNYALIAGMIGGALPDVPFMFIRTFDLDWGWLYAAAEINAYFHGPTTGVAKLSLSAQFLLALFSVLSVEMNRDINIKLTAHPHAG